MAGLTSSGLSVGAKRALLPPFEGLRHSPSTFQASLRVRTCDIGRQQSWIKPLDGFLQRSRLSKRKQGEVYCFQPLLRVNLKAVWLLRLEKAEQLATRPKRASMRRLGL